MNLDIFRQKDERLEESANLPAQEVIAREIADDPKAALEPFATIAEDLKREKRTADHRRVRHPGRDAFAPSALSLNTR